VAALHQTCMPDTRVNGTISSLDIQRYLMSRHGLEITYGQACDIIHGLGGGSLSQDVIGMIADPRRLSSVNESIKRKRRVWQLKTPEEQVLEEAAAAANENKEYETELYHPKVKYLDIVQVMSIVLIPALARFAKEGKQDTPIEAPVEDIPYKDENNEDQEDESPAGETATLSKDDNKEESPSDEEPEKVRPEKNREVRFDTQSEVKETGARRDDGERPSLKDFGKAQSVREIDENAPRLQPEPIGLIQDVLKMLLRDYTNSSLYEEASPEEAEDPLESGDPASMEKEVAPLLTPKLVEALLLENGDFERARDAALIRRMVDAAHSPSGRFDEEALINALTSDLDLWEVGCEDRQSTYVFDVFGTDDIPAFQRLGENQAKEQEDKEDLEDPSTKDDDDDTVKLLKKRSGKVIDSVVDSYASFFSLILIWLFFLGFSSVYSQFLKAADFSKAQCQLDGESSFPCTLLSTLYTW
jgi:hypothetical protein